LRKRKPGAGRIGELKTIYEKLFFTLFYFKVYPTQRLFAFLFNLDGSNGNRNIHALTPLLEKVLGEKMLLPKRKIRTLEELFENFPEVKDLLLDGTERPTQRPKDNGKQKEHYSGKKKRHTKKNTVITDEDKRIRYLGPTIGGKNHDYGTFKKEFPMEPSNLRFGCSLKHERVSTEPPPTTLPPKNGPRLWNDLGYVGIEKDYPWLNVIMPFKKPKGKKLTADEKAVNKMISGIRVKVEHAIGGVKRLGVVSDVFRNRKKGFDDKVMLVACGLWNYH